MRNRVSRQTVQRMNVLSANFWQNVHIKCNMSAIFRAVAALNALCGLTFPIKNGSLEEVILRRITRYGVHAPERQACCKMRGQQMT